MSNKSSRLKRLVKRPFRAAKFVANLPEAQATAAKHHAALSDKHEELYQEVKGFKNHIDIQQANLDNRIKILDDRITDVLHQLTILNQKPQAQIKSSQPEKAASNSQLIADEHLLDQFYVQFEHWFRGTEEEITKRQSVYLPYFLDSPLDSKKYPVIDIGCGNGEFVGVLEENGIKAIGLDLNKAMVDNVNKKGLTGIQGDALSYLSGLKPNSVKAITGFHIVEHIPFLDLVKIFTECYRVLAPGGFVLFETPNPENVIVGTCNFYNDPSHLHPLPPSFLEFTIKTRGFPKTEIKRLHPLKKTIKSDDPLVQEMADRFFGPQDYAVIAHK
jgi:O-antigen chain-terminating methyltransferase